MKDITISRRSLLVSAGLLALAPLAGCGGNSGSGSAAAGSDYTVGILQLTEHSALDAANDGFVKAIKESGLKVKIDQKNAQNDQSTCKSIADKFVGDGVDLIYAIATPAAQAAAGATADIPIVGCAITDYAASGLVQDNDKPGTNVTGASDLTPVAEQLEMMQKVLPDVKEGRPALLHRRVQLRRPDQGRQEGARQAGPGVHRLHRLELQRDPVRRRICRGQGRRAVLPHRQHHRRGRFAGRPDLQGE